jgi:hypothetical protein
MLHGRHSVCLSITLFQPWPQRTANIGNFLGNFVHQLAIWKLREAAHGSNFGFSQGGDCGSIPHLRPIWLDSLKIVIDESLAPEDVLRRTGAIVSRPIIF